MLLKGGGAAPHPRVLPTVAALPWEDRTTISRTGVQNSAHTGEGCGCPRGCPFTPIPARPAPFAGWRPMATPYCCSGLCSPSLQLPVPAPHVPSPAGTVKDLPTDRFNPFLSKE